MRTTSFRKRGGSIILVVPPALADALQWRTGAKVGLTVRGDRLIVEPQPRLRRTLDELLGQCDPQAPRAMEEREWLDSEAIGRELI